MYIKCIFLLYKKCHSINLLPTNQINTTVLFTRYFIYDTFYLHIWLQFGIYNYFTKSTVIFFFGIGLLSEVYINCMKKYSVAFFVEDTLKTKTSTGIIRFYL